jgi:hypothetical protein
MPGNLTVECDEIPLPANVSVSDNCGEVTLTFVETETGGTCENDYVLTRTWTAYDNCNNTIVHEQIINVHDNTPPVIECPEDIVTGICANINIDVPVASDNCDDDVMLSWVRDDGATDLNAPFDIGITSITFTATDNCGNTDECTMTVTIHDVPELYMSMTYGDDFDNLICGQHELNSIDVIVSGGNGADGYNYAFSFTNPLWYIVEGNSGFFMNGEHSFTINAEGEGGSALLLEVIDVYGCATATDTLWFDQCVPEHYCSYTQGFYGNQGGTGCLNGEDVTAYDIMSDVMMPYDTEPFLFGLPTNGWELYYHDITSLNIFKMLPGGGSSAPFDVSFANSGVGTYNDPATWEMVPLKTHPVNAEGKIENNLFAQTLAFFFNMSANIGFGDMEITGEYLITADAIDCGTQLASEYVELITQIPTSVVDFLNDPGNGYDPTAQGLFLLANDLLGGASSLQDGNAWVISHSDVGDALAAFNEGFDECRIFVEFTDTPPDYVDSDMPDVDDEEDNGDVDEGDEANPIPALEVSAHPNPFKKKIHFNFNSTVGTHLKFEIYTVSGSLMGILFDDFVYEDTDYHLKFSGSQMTPGVYFYRITTDYGTYNGKFVKQ